ncbi:MAG: metallophosphoesterase [Verrucomicrobia bacterium]|nr:MAG: metallophosphoesterase [Verrucomicrobiota bacterium]
MPAHPLVPRPLAPKASEPRLWRIAVFADTHDHYPPGLPARLADADELWHLGDVCEPEVLVEFEQLGCPLRVVLGNNDCEPSWPLVVRAEREGRRFHLEHIAPRRAPPGAEFVLSGHTHVPSDVTDSAGVRWLNPGCITRPRGHGRSFAWLVIAPDGTVTWTLVPL